MTQTDTATAGASPIRVPPGNDIYDALMGPIERDLLTVNIPLLDEKYKGETPEQKAARYQRYQDAYAKYDQAFETWITQFRGTVEGYRRQAFEAAEQEDRAKEANTLSNLESQLSIT